METLGGFKAGQSRAGKRGTTPRTLRLPAELEARLAEIAASRGMAEAALVASILHKFAVWDSTAGEIGYVHVPKSLYRHILSATDPKKMQRVAKETFVSPSKDIMSFWFREVTLESYLDWLVKRATYGGDVRVKTRKEGRNVTLTLTHDLGRPYTSFLRSVLDMHFRVLLKVVPRIETSASTIKVRVKVPR